MPLTGSFDATQFAPNQGGEAHPVGKFQAQITGTLIKPTKDNLNKVQGCENDGMLTVEFTTPAGSIADNFQLWNKNVKAVEIAHGQLSALCHAVGIFRLDWQNDGAALRGGLCMIEVGPQLDKQTKQPNGYVEIKRFYDKNGNEPGKQQAVVQPQAQQPMTQQPSGSWGNGQQPNQPTPNAGWGQPQQQPAQTQPGWQQNTTPAPGNKPPWAS